jgi:hypothetical protein
MLYFGTVRFPKQTHLPHPKPNKAFSYLLPATTDILSTVQWALANLLTAMEVHFQHRLSVNICCGVSRNQLNAPFAIIGNGTSHNEDGMITTCS